MRRRIQQACTDRRAASGGNRFHSNEFRNLAGSRYPWNGGTVARGLFYGRRRGFKGNYCCVWTGNNANGAPVWKPAKDKSTAAEIVHAVAVREGKALPAFVDLPLSEVSEGSAK